MRIPVGFRRARLIPRLVPALLCSACGSGDLPSGPSQSVATLELTGPGLPLLVGATTTLIATPRDAAGAPLDNVPISWSSSAEAVAAVSPTGVVTARSAGVTTVTARAGARSVSHAITVRRDALRSLEITVPRNPEVVGATDTLQLTGYDVTGTAVIPPAVTWHSSSNVVAIGSDGVLMARGPGTTIITARSGPVSAAVEFIVLTALVDHLSFLAPPDSLAVGQTLTLTLAGHVPDGSQVSVDGAKWTSSDLAVASVTNTGTVTAVGPGGAYILARVGTLEAGANLRVWAPVPHSIQLAGPVRAPRPGETFVIEATILDATGTPMPWVAGTWTTSDPSVVSVDNGICTVHAPGTVTIQLSAGGVTASIQVTVDWTVAFVAVLPPGEFGDTIQLSPGQQLQLRGYTFDSEGRSGPPPSPFAWSSSDPAVATVDDGGLVTAAGSGTVTVSATVGPVTGVRRIRVAATGGTVSVRLVNANATASPVTLRTNTGGATTLAYGEIATARLPAGTLQVSADGYVPVLPSVTAFDWYGLGEFSGFLPPDARATVVAVGDGGYGNLFNPVNFAVLWDRIEPVPVDSSAVRVVLSASGGTYGAGYNVYLTEPDAPMTLVALQGCYLDWPYGWTAYVSRAPGAFDIVLQAGKFGATGPEVARFHVAAPAGGATTFILTGTSPANLQVLTLNDR